MTISDKISVLETKISEFNDVVDTKQIIIDGKVLSSDTSLDLLNNARNDILNNKDISNDNLNASYDDLESAKSNVNYQNISEFLASKIVDAVDVFIYDTSKDSDGGAWRKRCSKLSWYNEPLNTATRGSRREFPAVAVIVAESTKVTIYDGDDPAMPVWMVFNLNNQDQVSIAALNGIVLLGNKRVANAFYGGNGLNILDFVADRWRTSLRNGSVPWLVPEMPYIKSGVMTHWFPTTTSGPRQVYPLIDYTVNDVAMTVLPDAPIDSATGLPIPTIAVATNGGLSVIKDNGAVVDIVNYSNYRTMRVEFDKQGRLFVHDAHPTVTGYGAVAQFNQLPDADVTTVFNNHPDGDVLYDANFNGWNLPRSNSSNNLGWQAISAEGGELALGSYSTGLARLKYTEDGDGIAAFHGHDHAAYYATRDIKGVFLAETAATNLTASVELNEDVDMLNSSLWTYSADGIDWTVSGQVTITEQNGSDRILTRDISGVVEGKYYRVEIEYTNSTTATSGNRIYFAGGTYYVLSAVSQPTTRVFYAKARGQQNLGILLSSTNATTTVLRMSVKEVDFDRHINPNDTTGTGPVGLNINGTITRSPVATGAELVAYSGFSASNYLEQPYNPDLDFGTGDFCVMGWLTSGNTPTSVMLSRGDNTQANTNDAFVIGLSATGTLIARWYDAAGTLLANLSGTKSFALGTSVWKHFSLSRKNGVVKIHIDGVEDVLTVTTGQATAIGGSTSPKLVLGKSAASIWPTNTWSVGGSASALALLRISATAPTAEQIRKIYNDEKFLFQENASCTLYGTSDAVTALAYDSDTDLLHVGTSSGRSYFKGLRRINNTTTPINTAISASNGMIIEQ